MTISVRAYYTGMDDDLDRRACEAVGREFSDSGYWVPDNERDMGWYFQTQKEADEAAESLKMLGMKVKIDTSQHN